MEREHQGDVRFLTLNRAWLCKWLRGEGSALHMGPHDVWNATHGNGFLSARLQGFGITHASNLFSVAGCMLRAVLQPKPEVMQAAAEILAPADRWVAVHYRTFAVDVSPPPPLPPVPSPSQEEISMPDPTDNDSEPKDAAAGHRGFANGRSLFTEAEWTALAASKASGATDAASMARCAVHARTALDTAHTKSRSLAAGFHRIGAPQTTSVTASVGVLVLSDSRPASEHIAALVEEADARVAVPHYS